MVEAVGHLLLCALAISTQASTDNMPPQEGMRMMSTTNMSTTTERDSIPWCPILEKDNQQVGVMGRLARLEELQRMKELVEAEIRLVKATISEELLEERK